MSTVTIKATPQQHTTVWCYHSRGLHYCVLLLAGWSLLAAWLPSQMQAYSSPLSLLLLLLLLPLVSVNHYFRV